MKEVIFMFNDNAEAEDLAYKFLALGYMTRIAPGFDTNGYIHVSVWVPEANIK